PLRGTARDHHSRGVARLPRGRKAMTAAPRVAEERLVFLDALRGFALVMMVWNHSARWWQDRSLGWPWYYSFSVTMAGAAPTFLFLVGFSMSLSLSKTADPGDAFAALGKYAVRGGRVILAGLLLNVLVFPEDPFWSNGVLQTIGLGIIVAAPVGLFLQSAVARALTLAVALLVYVSFGWSFGSLCQWGAPPSPRSPPPFPP